MPIIQKLKKKKKIKTTHTIKHSLNVKLGKCHRSTLTSWELLDLKNTNFSKFDKKKNKPCSKNCPVLWNNGASFPNTIHQSKSLLSQQTTITDGAELSIGSDTGEA